MFRECTLILIVQVYNQKKEIITLFLDEVLAKKSLKLTTKLEIWKGGLLLFELFSNVSEHLRITKVAQI